jgi:hypothetical protein
VAVGMDGAPMLGALGDHHAHDAAHGFGRAVDDRVGVAAPIGVSWQRLKAYERFVDMIDRHWDGIAAYCNPDKKSRWG